jgi:hypothetical protein
MTNGIDPSRPATAEVERCASLYPDVPIEAIIKSDILSRGISWSAAALDAAARAKPKAYFIFSFDMVPIEQMSQSENRRAPEEIRLVGGPLGFQPTVVSVRLNPSSPYCIERTGEALSLTLEGHPIAGVELQKPPAYYDRALRNGKPIMDIAPTIEWGYLVYLAVFRLCQYFGDQEECRFCDINENYRQQKRSGRPYTAVKSVEEILEALEIVAATDSESKAYTVTGGSITQTLDGMSEADFYARYPEAIEQRFPGRWISKVVAQPLPLDEVRRLRDAGVQIYHPNYEIWDRRLFDVLCAGKARLIGWEEHMRRIVEAAAVFGPEKVIPNFVAGIEMSQPDGFQSVDEAIASTAAGLDFFMSRSIVPRFTTWCPEPLSALGRASQAVPLEYHARLLRVYRDTHARHGLAAPPGYGEPGLGKAVFSVSPFMDVLPRSPSGKIR